MVPVTLKPARFFFIASTLPDAPPQDYCPGKDVVKRGPLYTWKIYTFTALTGADMADCYSGSNLHQSKLNNWPSPPVKTK